jgi:hypothetical protein
MYADVLNHGVNVNPQDVPGGLRKMAVNLCEYVFKQNIKWVKVVNLRSQKPG